MTHHSLPVVALSATIGLAAFQQPRVRTAKDGLRYLLLPAGTFVMGCSEGDTECGPKEEPAHRVMLTRSFWIGETEVTVAAYERFAAATGRKMPAEPSYSARSAITFVTNPGWSDKEQPMVTAAWEDAAAYCTWVGGRLPTEAEWEYAARAGETNARYGPADAISWNSNNSGRAPLDSEAVRIRGGQRELTTLLAPNGNRTQPVGKKAPNRFGLFDVLGNAFEWVADWYGEFKTGASTDPTGPATGTERVIRGGSFGAGPWAMRLSVRASDRPSGTHDPGIGFRCAMDEKR